MSEPKNANKSNDKGGTLSLLELRGVGPAKVLRFEPAERVNLITGDNGLGKTFLLECAWWALSGTWTGSPAHPRPDAKKDEPRITFRAPDSSGKLQNYTGRYYWRERPFWHPEQGKPRIPGFLIYAKVDEGFAISDPAIDKWGGVSRATIEASEPQLASSGFLNFARDTVLEGLHVNVKGATKFLSNGLISDWVNWQNTPETSPFGTLKKVLRRLSPPDVGDLGPLEPGKPVRVHGDSRWIPTIKHPYGDVPLIYASAGVRRIVALAYLIVWAWEEHKTQAELIRDEPQRRMVILVDEMEAHLHPQWQRVILPALLAVQEDLEADLQIQFLITTHSPLVMASMESRFDTEKDKIFHLDLIRHGSTDGEVTLVLEELDFVRRGPVDSWLMSEVFEMRHARSLEAEQAIEDAKNLQMKDKVTTDEVREVTERLVKYLAGTDKFWPRWTFFAEKHGVEI